jgi:hypothetical protein
VYQSDQMRQLRAISMERDQGRRVYAFGSCKSSRRPVVGLAYQLDWT